METIWLIKARWSIANEMQLSHAYCVSALQAVAYYAEAIFRAVGGYEKNNGDHHQYIEDGHGLRSSSGLKSMSCPIYQASGRRRRRSVCRGLEVGVA